MRHAIPGQSAVRPLNACVPVLLLLLTAGCQMVHNGPLEAKASDEWVRSYDLDAGGEFQIVGAAGTVDIQGRVGDRVEVRAERVARAASESTATELVPRIKIREDLSPQKIVLQTEGLGGIVLGVEVAVNYHVMLPAASRIRVRTTDGALTIDNISGQVVASSVNGQITGRGLSGGVEARTVNGSLVIDLVAFSQNPVDLRATNGRIELALPAAADANILANATNGAIEIKELAFEPLGDQTKRRVRGRINAGGPPIELSVVNGAILVHSRQ